MSGDDWLPMPPTMEMVAEALNRFDGSPVDEAELRECVEAVGDLLHDERQAKRWAYGEGFKDGVAEARRAVDRGLAQVVVPLDARPRHAEWVDEQIRLRHFQEDAADAAQNVYSLQPSEMTDRQEKE